MSNSCFEDYHIGLQYEPDGTLFAEVRELPGCFAAGPNPAEALEMLRDSFELWVEDALERGLPIPLARSDAEPSGRVLLRMPSSLHARLASEAEHQGVSLNAMLNVILADAVGFARGERCATEPKASPAGRAHAIKTPSATG